MVVTEYGLLDSNENELKEFNIINKTLMRQKI